MSAARLERVLSVACVFGLASLALMVWSLFDPRPLPVVAAMSVGQLLGTLSLGAFVLVVVADMRRAHLERPPHEPGEPPAPEA